jgi:hypothetical protein
VVFYLSGFVGKRAELTGEIKLLERLEQLRSDVLHVDAAIRIIDPAFKLDSIVPKSAALAATGSATAS